MILNRLAQHDSLVLAVKYVLDYSHCILASFRYGSLNFLERCDRVMNVTSEHKGEATQGAIEVKNLAGLHFAIAGC